MPMVVAAARVLCKRSAEQCNVDAHDNWKVYGDDYLADAAAALDAAAAPDLLAVCLRLAESASYWSEYDVPLGIVADLQAAIAKATGAAL